MCVLCSVLWTEDHWAEAGADDPAPAADDTVVFEVHVTRRGQRLRDRGRRAQLATAVLTPYGLQLQDWEGSSYILRDRKGSSAVAPDLAALWQEADRMLGRPLDPLDPEFLDAVRRRLRPTS